MSNQEAIEIMKRYQNGINYVKDDAVNDTVAFNIAIQAIEKQIPKAAEVVDSINFSSTTYFCPSCECMVELRDTRCECGQLLDWSDRQ